MPCFTTRSPFKTPLSNLVGNLWRGVRKRRYPKGLVDRDEREDVESLGRHLDENSFEWLMEHTQSEEVYVEAVKAQREYARRQSKGSQPTTTYNTIA
jgi:hypothetical protein